MNNNNIEEDTVPISLYNELVIKYNNKTQKCKELQNALDDIIDSSNKIKESFEFIKNNEKKERLDFSTAKSTEITFLRTSKPNQIENIILLKKIDDLENYLSDINREFNNMVKKYSLIKEEKEKLENYINKKKGDMDKYLQEINELNILLDRYKEIDKNIVDNTLSSYILNTKEKHKKEKKSEYISGANNSVKGAENAPYIVCEPVPSFIKFITTISK